MIHEPFSPEQQEQDRIWNHFQNRSSWSFDASVPRLRFFAERCEAGERVLNIGAGSGMLEKLLADRGVQVFSLDPNAETIEKLRADLDLGERAKQGYSHAIPFGAGHFDKVIMTEVLEHLPEETLHSTLDDVRRVLKRDGYFTGSVPYRENLRDNEVICPHCQSQFHRWGHSRSFEKATLSRLFDQHGFAVERLYPRSFPDFRRPSAKLFVKALFRYVLGRLGEPLVGPNLYFLVRPRQFGADHA